MTYPQALSRLIACQGPLQVKQASLASYQPELAVLCGSFDHTGCLVRLRNKNLALIIEQSNTNPEFGILEFNQKNINDQAEYSTVATDQVRILLPQQLIDQSKLVELLLRHDQQTNSLASDKKPKTKTSGNQSALSRYSANDSWRIISRSFLSANNKTLSNVLAKYPEQSKLLLDYATQHNRQQLAITDLNHAIAMLGSTQLFPTLCNDNIKVKQVNAKQIGSDVVNYKINLFSQILFELHDLTSLGLPKYHELIARVLIISLMTIPKVSYAASTPACLVTTNRLKIISLADLFGLTSLDNWKKISLLLSKSWLLPKKYNQVIEQYFDLLTSDQPISTTNKSLNKNTLLIIIASYLFQHLINGENKLTTNKPIEALMVNVKLTDLSLKQIYEEVRKSLTIYTPLS